jgi:hypothetical protein
MNTRTFTRFVLLVLLGLGYTITGSNAQDLSPWTDNPYGNEWIDYSKKYVRVGVTANGLYKVPFGVLSTSLKKGTETITPAQIQLWHRGKEVAIISADNNWVVFYGEKNDGASDGLMFRPGPEARLNPYVSFFSEEGSYFFTTSDQASRIISLNGDPSGSLLVAEPYHFEKFVKKFDEYEANGKRENPAKQVFSFSTFVEGSTLNHSYYERSNSWTSPVIYGPSFVPIGGGASQPKSYSSVIQLKNIQTSILDKPVFEIVVNGHDEGQHNVRVHLSSTSADVDSKLIATMPFNSYGGVKSSVNLDYDVHVSSAGNANLLIKSVTTDSKDAFGISYFSIVYPQSTDMAGVTSKILNFKATQTESSVVSIANVATNTKVYDISNAHQPKMITGGIFDGASSVLRIKVPRINNSALKLLVVSSSHVISEVVKINGVDLNPLYANSNVGVSPTTNVGAINPLAYDYLIITNNDSDPARAGDRDMRTGAVAYARDYRSQVKGGAYACVVMDIRTIYDQFNYGEPSAVAIKRFVDYMIQNGVRSKHNLLLIGYSVTIPVNVVKEMPGEVPSFGDPGSDVLLVTGLKNSPNIDIPAIPVGRINAFSNTELTNYLTKVIEYERQSMEDTESSLSWRKNIVHLVGAKRNYELSEFKDIFTGVSAHALQLDPSRSIKVLSNDAYATSASVDAVSALAPMASEVNPGVGMIAYYGHGNQQGTIYNIGKVSAPAFTSNNKYSFIYFNGCGVGNIFTSRGTQMLATDWLITPSKGAIAIFGNSYKSYVAPTKIYIDELYKQIFLKNDQLRRTTGQILKDMASLTVGERPGGRILADAFSTTNIHQTNLYGDPALKILNTTPPTTLPVKLVNFKASLSDSNLVSLNWVTAWENENSHFILERSYNSKNFEEIGLVDGHGDKLTVSNYQFIDRQPFPAMNYYRLKQVDKSNSGEPANSTYSKVVSISVPNSEAFYVYPNPATDQISFNLNLPVKVVSWSVRTLNGTHLIGGDTSTVNLQKLMSGTYILEALTEKGDIFRTTFLKK